MAKDKTFPKNLRKDFEVLKKLNTPAKIQDFVNAIPFNFEKQGETCRTPLMVLKHKEAHCMEGAMLAAAAFWYHGKPPLLLDLKSTKNKPMKDDDHVVALFNYKSYWGAVSKTNHGVLRYREPVYKTIRELALSYFHEYFLDSGRKTLRSYSAPFDLSHFDSKWLTEEKNQWDMAYKLDISSHFEILPPGLTSKLRPADPVEIEAGKVVQWKTK
jgi:hypothetical protein